jgi:hypothetical protein
MDIIYLLINELTLHIAKFVSIIVCFLLGNSPVSEFYRELSRRKHTRIRTRGKFVIKNVCINC